MLKILYLSVVLIHLATSTVGAQSFTSDGQAVSAALSAWHTDVARKKLESLLQRSPNDPVNVFLEAHLLYLEGNYAASLERFETLPMELKKAPAVARLHSQVKKTEAALRTFTEYTSPDGKFLVRYSGKDKILLPHLLEVLDKAHTALSADFNYLPQAPILVEVYPTIDYLAEVSSLTQKALETSGTIALYSDNRLMLTSPRGLAKGYNWRDTLAHEFVHYYVTKVSKNTVPIWLHEGIAKFQETRWRDPPGHRLDPPPRRLARSQFEKRSTHLV